MREVFWKRLNYVFGLLAIGMLFGLIVLSANIEIKDLDLWLHIATGRFIVQNGYVPTTDVLSCSIAGQPWINHEWLFQVIVYKIYSLGGSDGLITMQAVVVSLTFLLLLFLVYTRERQLGVIFMLILVFLVYEFRFTIRPDIFSLLFFTLYIYILSLYIDRRGSVLALFIIQVLWTNSHGFFFFGPLIVLIGIISEAIKRRVRLPYEWNSIGRLNDEEYKRLKWIFVAVIVACSINPYGFKGAWYPVNVLLSISGDSKIFFQYIQELQKPVTWDTLFTPFYSYYKLLIILSFVSFVFNRWKIDISSFFFWLLFLFFSLAASRNIVFFAFVSYFICMSNFIGISIDEISPLHFEDKKFAYLTSLVLTVGLMIWMLNYGMELSDRGYYDYDKYERKSEMRGITQRNYPNKAVDFLIENHVKGNFFNDFNSGAYILGRCHPNIKVYIDGRTEVYGAAFFMRYQKFWKDGKLKDFPQELERLHITGALLNSVYKPVPEDVLKFFSKQKDWVMVYFDYDAVIYLKDVPENKKVIEQNRLDLSKWKTKGTDLLRLGATQILPYRNINRAYTLETLGFDDAAIGEAQAALEVCPGYGDPYKILGKIYGKKEDHKKAFESFRIATMIFLTDVETRYNLALAYEKLGEYKYAIKQYEKILRNAQQQPKAYFMLSRAYAKDKQYNNSLEALRQAHKLDKAAVSDILEITDIVYGHKEYNTALTMYSLALEGKKDQAKVHHKLGLCQQALGNKAMAKAEFEKGLAIDPKNEDLKKSLQNLN